VTAEQHQQRGKESSARAEMQSSRRPRWWCLSQGLYAFAHRGPALGHSRARVVLEMTRLLPRRAPPMSGRQCLKYTPHVSLLVRLEPAAPPIGRNLPPGRVHLRLFDRNCSHYYDLNQGDNPYADQLNLLAHSEPTSSDVLLGGDKSSTYADASSQISDGSGQAWTQPDESTRARRSGNSD
jgi:hypothetical protein